MIEYEITNCITTEEYMKMREVAGWSLFPLEPGYKVMIMLMAAKGKEEFYNKFGFVNRPSERFGCGMHQWLDG